MRARLAQNTVEADKMPTAAIVRPKSDSEMLALKYALIQNPTAVISMAIVRTASLRPGESENGPMNTTERPAASHGSADSQPIVIVSEIPACLINCGSQNAMP